jgi:ParB family transcriptional regulator, chromosome partitioning protein
MTASTPRSGSGLGRGLAALIPTRDDAHRATELPIAAISRNPFQPRRLIDQQALADLALSIAEHGVLQPVLVTPTAEGYQLVAGERRLRAAEMAGLEHIPALVRSISDNQQLSLALVENLQRADLNPLDEARAMRQLLDEFGLTQEDVARRLGRSRSAIANTIRLLDAAPAVREALEQGLTSEGHARALGGLSDHAAQARALQAVLARGLSVRQTEELVRRLVSGGPTARSKRSPSPELDRLERGLRDALGTKVRLSSGRRGGRITIEYYDDDDLSRLYDRLTRAQS